VNRSFRLKALIRRVGEGEEPSHTTDEIRRQQSKAKRTIPKQRPANRLGKQQGRCRDGRHRHDQSHSSSKQHHDGRREWKCSNDSKHPRRRPSRPCVYQTILFFWSLWVADDLLCGRIIRILPPLVGPIAVGDAVGVGRTARSMFGLDGRRGFSIPARQHFGHFWARSDWSYSSSKPVWPWTCMCCSKWECGPWSCRPSWITSRPP
jgi:hypothetical protein